MTDTLVLVTGAGGFLASHIVKQLLEKGYKVRGSVRSLNDTKEVSYLKYLIEKKNFPLELIEADLLVENSWIDAVKDCSYVIHTASPVLNYVPDDENEVNLKRNERNIIFSQFETFFKCIKPAVNGVLNVFNACVGETSIVKRIVLTRF